MNEELRDEVADELFRSKHLGAAMAFGVPGEAWEDCRRGIADALMPLLERREREAAARALRDAADLLVAECSTLSTPCFCSSAPWLRDRADAITNADASTEETS